MSHKGVQMLILICGSIIPLQVKWFPPQGYVSFHNMVDGGMPTSSLPCWRDLSHLECWLCIGGVIPLVSRELVVLGTFDTSLQLIMVNLLLSQLLFMVSFHLRTIFWSYWRVSASVIIVGGGLEPSKGVLCLRSDQVLIMDEQERDDERSWVCFTTIPQWAPNVLTKIQN